MIRVQGHRAGAESVRDVVKAAGEFGVKYLTLYAFSVENWTRPKTEVHTLMGLLETFLRDELPEMIKNNVRLQAIGRLSDLPENVRDQLHMCHPGHPREHGPDPHPRPQLQRTRRDHRGGSTRSSARSSSAISTARKSTSRSSIITSTPATIPIPDLLIRTSGEMRLSNFLLWQLSYTEIYITSTFWPDFRRQHFAEALIDYGSRQRRFGSL